MDEDFGGYDFGGYDSGGYGYDSGWGSDYGAGFGAGYGGDYGYGTGYDYGYGSGSTSGGWVDSTQYGWGGDMGYGPISGYDPYGGAYAESGDFNGTQVADASSASAASPIVDRSTQMFDDGTSLTTLTDATGRQTNYSSWTDTQVFDDGSKLKTTTEDWGYGLKYTDYSSVDSLDSRLSNGLGLIDPRTTSPADIETAQDVMNNYQYMMRPNEISDLNTFINDYYLNQNSMFPNDPPTGPYQGQDPYWNFG